MEKCCGEVLWRSVVEKSCQRKFGCQSSELGSFKNHNNQVPQSRVAHSRVAQTRVAQSK